MSEWYGDIDDYSIKQKGLFAPNTEFGHSIEVVAELCPTALFFFWCPTALCVKIDTEGSELEVPWPFSLPYKIYKPRHPLAQSH